MLLFKEGTGRSGPLRWLAVVLVAVALATGSPALAQTPQEPPSSAPSEKVSADRGPTDEREVEAFLDGYVGHQLEDYNIPGATVSVVKDGEVLFAKGYGQANIEKKVPVVADETLFRTASISKLFTATAVMQLVEEGQLDLDEDVNAYLDDVRVRDTYPGRPITLRHLLTHTAGFEEHFTGSGARSAADVEPLGEYLSGQMPTRVRPPGEVTAYSNYGMSLAGHVVEEVSGVPFERYVEENVLAPLDMESTTAAQPPAPELRERLATGYDLEGARPVARPLEYFDDAPAGTVSTTATDMARFMIAHLQDGRYDGARILKESTAQEMHERQFTNAPRLDGMAYGFYEQTINGERTIQHGGNLFQFHANLALLPEQDVGIFVAYNSYGDGGDFAEYELVEAFLDRYYPVAPPTLEPSGEGASRNAERLAGSYRITRSNHTGFEKILTLLTGARVTANEDGSITTTGGFLSRDLEDTEQRWVEVKPLLFRAEDRNEYIAFREDSDRRALYLSGDADPTVAYQKVSPYEAPRLHLGLLAGSLGILLLTAVAWPAGAIIARRYRRRYGKPGGEPGGDARRARLARLLAWAVCALDLLFVIGVALVFSNLEETLAYGASPSSLMAILTLPLLSAALAAGVLACALLAWKRGYWGVVGRLHYSLVALSALTFVVLLAYYNLLGFRF
jgi:CubicO group peptidase (beta-lactamase class C family)